MNRFLLTLCLSVSVTISWFIPGSFVWSIEGKGANAISSDTSNLSSLVQQFLHSGAKTQNDLKERIVSRPDATLDHIVDILQAGPEYGKTPVGMLPSQQIRVRGQQFEYGLYVPETYDPASKSALIICLHGAGFNGDSYLERWAPRLHNGYILACPTISMGAWWTRTAEDLVLAIMRAVRSQYHIDPDRIFLTGMSNGGIGAWIIGMHHASKFAGIAPMASGIDTALYPFLDNLAQTSVYVIHGAQDQIMPVSLSRKLIEEMKKRNIHYVYREHNLTHPHAGGHFFPREELPALVEWFDQQRRNALPRQLTVVRDATHLDSFIWVRIDATDRIAAFTENLIDSQDDFIKERRYAYVRAEFTGSNHIVVRTNLVLRLSIFLNSDLVDFGAPVTVEINGKTTYHQSVKPDIHVLLQQARIRQDPQQLFPVHLVLPVTP